VRQKTGSRSSDRNMVMIVIKSIGDFFGEIVDKFTANKNLSEFLKSKGMGDSKRFEKLMSKMILIRSENEMILYDVVKDILDTRVNRRSYYIYTIKRHNESLNKIRIDANKHAANEIKQKNKSVFKNNVIKYGFFKAFKYTKKYFSDVNLDKMHEELANYYLKNSNIELMEHMIESLKFEYHIEEKIFIECLTKLYKKYVKKIPEVFERNNINKNLNIIPWDMEKGVNHNYKISGQ
jgi:hypothetical protein